MKALFHKVQTALEPLFYNIRFHTRKKDFRVNCTSPGEVPKIVINQNLEALGLNLKVRSIYTSEKHGEIIYTLYIHGRDYSNA